MYVGGVELLVRIDSFHLINAQSASGEIFASSPASPSSGALCVNTASANKNKAKKKYYY